MGTPLPDEQHNVPVDKPILPPVPKTVNPLPKQIRARQAADLAMRAKHTPLFKISIENAQKNTPPRLDFKRCSELK